MFMLEATVTDALSTAFSGIADQVTGGITSVLPIALGVVGTVMVVTIGIKVFKKLMP